MHDLFNEIQTERSENEKLVTAASLLINEGEIFDFEIRVSQESLTFWIEALTSGADSVDFSNLEHKSFNIGIEIYCALIRSMVPSTSIQV